MIHVKSREFNCKKLGIKLYIVIYNSAESEDKPLA
jgi:hypothetical protein